MGEKKKHERKRTMEEMAPAERLRHFDKLFQHVVSAPADHVDEAKRLLLDFAPQHELLGDGVIARLGEQAHPLMYNTLCRIRACLIAEAGVDPQPMPTAATGPQPGEPAADDAESAGEALADDADDEDDSEEDDEEDRQGKPSIDDPRLDAAPDWVQDARGVLRGLFPEIGGMHAKLRACGDDAAGRKEAKKVVEKLKILMDARRQAWSTIDGWWAEHVDRGSHPQA